MNRTAFAFLIVWAGLECSFAQSQSSQAEIRTNDARAQSRAEALAPRAASANDDEDPRLRVFIFAGQSNMVGSDSKVKDIDRFPPFAGLGQSQSRVKFAFNLGRENIVASEGWVSLQPVNDVVGPELSFARRVTQRIDAPIAIIKCAAGGTHLGGDWNPDHPEGFQMYPRALKFVRSCLDQLREQGID